MAKKTKPNENERRNHNHRGRFVRGNKAAVGHSNPTASKVQKLHAKLVRTIKLRDIESIILKLIAMANEGDVQAAKVLLNRVFGKPQQFISMKNSPEPRLIKYPLKPPQKKKNKTSGLIGQQSKEGK